MAKEYLTTTQAAKICRVTRFTIANWVKKGKLKSSKTAGGHRRISKEDLLKFIKENKIVEIVEEDGNYPVLPCWKFEVFKDSSKHDCRNCLVFKEKARKCFLLVGEFGSEKVRCRDNCSKCQYLSKFYPRERKIIEKMNNELIEGIRNQVQKREIDVSALFRKGFYTSGKYLAAIKKALSREKK